MKKYILIVSSHKKNKRLATNLVYSHSSSILIEAEKDELAQAIALQYIDRLNKQNDSVYQMEELKELSKMPIQRKDYLTQSYSTKISRNSLQTEGDKVFKIITSIYVDPTRKTDNYIVNFRVFFKDDIFRQRLHNVYRNSYKFIIYGFYSRLWMRMFNPEKPFFIKFGWTPFQYKFYHIDTLFWGDKSSTCKFSFRKYEEAAMFLEELTERLHDLLLREYDIFLELNEIQAEVKQTFIT